MIVNKPFIWLDKKATTFSKTCAWMWKDSGNFLENIFLKNQKSNSSFEMLTYLVVVVER